MDKLKKIFILSISIILLIQGNVFAAEISDISYAKKMEDGRTIKYWISSECEYGVSIPKAVKKLMYPPRMSNPLVLYKTSIKDHAKIGFYQYSDTSTSTCAYAQRFRKNIFGVYYTMTTAEADEHDWIFSRIHINDAKLSPMSKEEREGIIIHEMLHSYGLKDQYYDESSIMYGYLNEVYDVTQDANYVLNLKYKE